MEILDDIPLRLDPAKVTRRVHLRRANKHLERIIQELIDIALPLANPKALYEVSYIDKKNGDFVYIDGIKFNSRILRVNLDKVKRIFPYVATCGRELDQIDIPSKNYMKRYYLEEIKDMILGSTVSYLTDYLRRKYALGQMSKMNPGSLEDWSITQQKQLFSVFGDIEDMIGVKLTESYLMVPRKSVSGIYFPTEIKFESCQLCPREVCVGRRAPYNPELVKKYAY